MDIILDGPSVHRKGQDVQYQECWYCQECIVNAPVTGICVQYELSLGLWVDQK